MGEIPIYTSKEKLTVTPPAMPLFSGEAISGVSELARHYENRQMQDDLVTAIDMEQKFNQWQDDVLNHPETGFLARRGADAKGSYEAFMGEAERTYLELNDGLENTNQRTLFEKRYQDRLQRAQDQIAAHEAREADVYRRTVLGDASITESRRAIELVMEGDTDGAGQALNMATRFLDQSLSDLPDEQQDEARWVLISSFHSEVFNRRLNDDPLAAAQYLFVNQKDIDPRVYEKLQQSANRRIEQVQGRNLFASVYTANAELATVFETIDASDVPDPSKIIAKGLADEQRAFEQAEQIAFEKNQIQSIEEAGQQAVQLIDEGASYDDLPDDLIDILSSDHLRAVRTVYAQKISGQGAPFNVTLENDLHDAWIRAINGKSGKFLSMQLAQHLGSHNRERLALWGRRQAGFKTVGPKYRAEVNRRKLALNIANRFVARLVGARGGDEQIRAQLKSHLNNGTTSYIFAWHDVHPGQVMEPKVLLEDLEALVGLIPTGRTHPELSDSPVNSDDWPEVASTDTSNELKEKPLVNVNHILPPIEEDAGLVVVADGELEETKEAETETIQNIAYDKFKSMSPEARRQYIEEFLNQTLNPDGINLEGSNRLGGTGSLKNLPPSYEFVEYNFLGFGPKGFGDTIAALRGFAGQPAVNPFSGRVISDNEVQENLFLSGIGTLGSLLAKTGRDVVTRLGQTAVADFREEILEAFEGSASVKKLLEEVVDLLPDSGIRHDPRLRKIDLDRYKSIHDALPAEILEVLNQETLRGGIFTRASRVALNIEFKGGIGAANQKYAEIVRNLGGDPSDSQPLGSVNDGLKFVLRGDSIIKVRPMSKKWDNIGTESAPTVEIEISVNKTYIKMRFRN